MVIPLDILPHLLLPPNKALCRPTLPHYFTQYSFTNTCTERFLVRAASRWQVHLRHLGELVDQEDALSSQQPL